MDNQAMFKLSYGLFVLTARDGEKDNGCIINTAIQAASTPNQLSICVNKTNHTHDMIVKTGILPYRFSIKRLPLISLNVLVLPVAGMLISLQIMMNVSAAKIVFTI